MECVFRRSRQKQSLGYEDPLPSQRLSVEYATMLLIKLILYVMGTGGSVLVGLLDYLWHDKRTKNFKIARVSLLFVVFPLLLMLGILVIVRDDRDHSSEVEGLSARLDEISRQAKNSEKLSAKRDAEHAIQLSNIHEQNKRLEAIIKPFVGLAHQRHPEISNEEALEKLRLELTQVAERAAPNFRVNVGTVKSVGQKGGVTAANVGSIH